GVRRAGEWRTAHVGLRCAAGGVSHSARGADQRAQARLGNPSGAAPWLFRFGYGAGCGERRRRRCCQLAWLWVAGHARARRAAWRNLRGGSAAARISSKAVAADSVIRVLVADDQTVVREGLVMLLSLSAGVEVVAAAVDGEQAIQLARQHRPDVVLMDLR